MEEWRKIAYAMIPPFRRSIDEAESPGMLWVDIETALESSSGETLIIDEALSEETLQGIFRYAAWCLAESDDKETQSAAAVDFYEMLPVNERLRRDLPEYMSVEEFLGLRELFDHHLSAEEYDQFIAEFLAKASHR